MKTPDTTHPQYKRAWDHAYALLQLPEAVLRIKLKERSGWGAHHLPTQAELAVMILVWVEDENAALSNRS